MRVEVVIIVVWCIVVTVGWAGLWFTDPERARTRRLKRNRADLRRALGRRP